MQQWEEEQQQKQQEQEEQLVLGGDSGAGGSGSIDAADVLPSPAGSVQEQPAAAQPTR